RLKPPGVPACFRPADPNIWVDPVACSTRLLKEQRVYVCTRVIQKAQLRATHVRFVPNAKHDVRSGSMIEGQRVTNNRFKEASIIVVIVRWPMCGAGPRRDISRDGDEQRDFGD